MNVRVTKANGFTLIEALIATVVSVIILGAVVGVFKSTSDTNRVTLLRADVQQDARGALNLINRDLSQASAGVPPSGIPVPPKALFACGPTTCYLGGVTYPNDILSPVTPDGTIGASGTSAITIAYLDTTWPVTNQNLLTIAPKGGTLTVDQRNFDISGNAVAPPAGKNYADPVVGTKVGDVLLLQNNNGAAVVTVTAVGGGGVLTLAGGDPLLFNVPGALRIADPKTGFTLDPKTGALVPPTVVSRINIVTYFVSTLPQFAPNGVPVLMRQVSAHPAVPVVEGVQDFQFTYDIFDSANLAGGPNGTYTSALPANLVTNASLIRKINMSLALRAKARDPQGNLHTLTINSSVSPRDLSFSDRYQ
jgi:type II secretory pathway pseudopilin PulG